MVATDITIIDMEKQFFVLYCDTRSNLQFWTCRNAYISFHILSILLLLLYAPDTKTKNILLIERRQKL